jgi:DnaJ-class molecular chaperone
MIISTAKANEAAGVLDLSLVDLTHEAVTKAYRNKAKDCHPDHHGNGKIEQWSKVSWAKECLNRWLAQRPAEEPQQAPVAKGDCRACRGTGRVVVNRLSRFGTPLTMACLVCKGLGAVIEEEDDHD